MGPGPVDEDVAQVGQSDYEERSYQECKIFLRQLVRQFGDGDLKIKSFPHDFGSYREVVVYYDPSDEESTNFAFRLEKETPLLWDDISRKELGC